MRHYIWVILAGIYLTGCATASRGTKDMLIVDTDPPGARVMTDKELASSKKARKKNPDLEPRFHGCPSTPCEIQLPRRSEFILTIAQDGYEPVEIGVDNGLSKESLNANLAGSAGTGAAMGIGLGIIAAPYLGGSTALGLGAASAGSMAAGVGVISLGVDAASGAMLNLRPNPIFVKLPPAGTDFAPHDKVAVIRRKRLGKNPDITKTQTREEFDAYLQTEEGQAEIDALYEKEARKP